LFNDFITQFIIGWVKFRFGRFRPVIVRRWVTPTTLVSGNIPEIREEIVSSSPDVQNCEENVANIHNVRLDQLKVDEDANSSVYTSEEEGGGSHPPSDNDRSKSPEPEFHPPDDELRDKIL
jgi:hypothetical protein